MDSQHSGRYLEYAKKIIQFLIKNPDPSLILQRLRRAELDFTVLSTYFVTMASSSMVETAQHKIKLKASIVF